jgi:hypothetical protein
VCVHDIFYFIFLLYIPTYLLANTHTHTAQEYFLMRCEAFSKQVAECYQGQELTLQSSTVQPMFENQHRAWLIKNGKA